MIDHKGVIRFEGLRGEALEKALEGLIKEANADTGEKPIKKETA